MTAFVDVALATGRVYFIFFYFPLGFRDRLTHVKAPRRQPTAEKVFFLCCRHAAFLNTHTT
jgi:hypothetical protein